MCCPEWNETISHHLAQELEPEKAILLEQHLAECTACSVHLETLEGIIAAQPPETEWNADLDLARRLFARAGAGTRREESAARRPVVSWLFSLPGLSFRSWLFSLRGLSFRSWLFPLRGLSFRGESVAAHLFRPIPSYAAFGLLLAGGIVGLWAGKFGQSGPTDFEAARLRGVDDITRSSGPKSSIRPSGESFSPRRIESRAAEEEHHALPRGEWPALADASAGEVRVSWRPVFATLPSDAMRLEEPTGGDSL